ncbi:LuxR C-terminal-related transcriptional regulator [Saccharopolyspora shandongensis]|uniref:ATP-binding protein n=1 Tax=Saccharopolyspora shandongensis TaxID=418495 RepID=UPI003429660E
MPARAGERGPAALVTLVAPGGTGKTRIALRVAHVVRDAGVWTDGVVWVDLAGVSPDSLDSHIAQALGPQRISAPSARAAVLEPLRRQHRLVVLDNCEHVIDVVDELVAELLQAAPGVSVLATSRDLLQIHGEVQWPLAPLDAPSPDVAGCAVSSDAMTLFAAVARRADPAFELDVHREAVARLVHQLGGTPLFIELVAAGMSVFASVEELERRFEGLAGYRRARSRVLDWSWERCNPDEKALWRRLAVFSGPADLDAVEHVAGLEDPVTTLQALIEKVILRKSVDSEGGRRVTRYRLLEMFQEYGAHQLAEAGEEDTVRQRHTQWCHDLIESFMARSYSSEAEVWLDQLRRALPDIRATLHRLQTADPDAGLRLAIDLTNARMPYISGDLREWGAEWITRLTPAASSPVLRAEGFAAASTAVLCRGLHAEALNLMQRAQSILDGQQDVPVRARIQLLWARGCWATFGGEPHDAVELWDEVLRLLHEHYPDLGSLIGLAGMWRAINAAAHAEPGTADRVTAGYLAETSARGDRHFGAWASWARALYCGRIGEVDTAIELIVAAILVLQRLRDNWGLPWSLVLSLLFAGGRGQWRHVAQLSGAVDAVMGLTDIAWRQMAALGDAAADAEAAAHAALGETVWAAGYAAGDGMSWSDAVVLPLTLFAEPAPGVPGDDRLTDREREVAALVAEELTDTEIARRLFISPRTASTHVSAILRKLGVQRRGEVAAALRVP